MKKNYQSGQALAEMVIGAFIMMLVLTALLYVAGYSISGVKYLITARRAAELNVEKGLGGLGQNIISWTYADTAIKRTDSTENYNIPFTAKDQANAGADNSGDIISPALSPLSSVHTPNNFYSSLSLGQLFISAANLTEGSGDFDGDAVYTLDTKQMPSSLSGKMNRPKLDNAIFMFFGLGPKNNINPVNIPANHVFLPVPSPLKSN